MQLGMIGLGRMGANMVRRLLSAGHACVVHNAQAENTAALVAEGASGVESVPELVEALQTPRSIWLMIPAGHVDSVPTNLGPVLKPGDLVILTAALYQRFASRGNADFANRVLSAMRFGFGGHREKGD